MELLFVFSGISVDYAHIFNVFTQFFFAKKEVFGNVTHWTLPELPDLHVNEKQESKNSSNGCVLETFTNLYTKTWDRLYYINNLFDGHSYNKTN